MQLWQMMSYMTGLDIRPDLDPLEPEEAPDAGTEPRSQDET